MKYKDMNESPVTEKEVYRIVTASTDALWSQLRYDKKQIRRLEGRIWALAGAVVGMIIGQLAVLW